MLAIKLNYDFLTLFLNILNIQTLSIYMKTTLIFILVLFVVIFISKGIISKNTNRTEQHRYTVIKSYSKFEVRRYEKAIFTSVKLKTEGYKETSSSGFKILAGYIFGDNKTNEKIAMTSPVKMEIGSTPKMSFMVPKGYSMNDLPDPNNKNLVFEMQEEKIIAAIQFDGWANDEKIEQFLSILKNELAKEKIVHTNNFFFLGYNPPFDLIDRRNEVAVELLNYE
jgi:hypothetical protein